MEVARRADGTVADGTVAVRDSKDPRRTEQIYTREEWSTFLRGAKAGEFDVDLSPGRSVDSPTIRFGG